MLDPTNPVKRLLRHGVPEPTCSTIPRLPGAPSVIDPDPANAVVLDEAHTNAARVRSPSQRSAIRYADDANGPAGELLWGSAGTARAVPAGSSPQHSVDGGDGGLSSTTTPTRTPLRQAGHDHRSGAARCTAAECGSSPARWTAALRSLSPSATPVPAAQRQRAGHQQLLRRRIRAERPVGGSGSRGHGGRHHGVGLRIGGPAPWFSSALNGSPPTNTSLSRHDYLTAPAACNWVRMARHATRPPNAPRAASSSASSARMALLIAPAATGHQPVQVGALPG